MDGEVLGVDDPTKDGFKSPPHAVPCMEFFQGDQFGALRGIIRVRGSEHIIDCL